MRQFRLFTIIITIALLTAMVVGCGAPTPTPAAPSPAPSAPKPSQTTAPMPEPNPTPPSRELPPSPYLPEVPRISVEEVKSKLDAGIDLVIIDSRSRNSYDQSHIAGSISIPFETMAESYSDLNGYDEIITYCI
jgi:hypothetical protein